MWGGRYDYDLNQMHPNLKYQFKGLVDQAVPNPGNWVCQAPTPGHNLPVKVIPGQAPSRFMPSDPDLGIASGTFTEW